ncbi:MAG: rsmD [Bacteroidetes bacterium]|jgi:16S rRNA (guanine(966)-N(2))-methyltransferase RsmD|nr:rsmD [Bacteroidota bacterium]
MRIIGGIHKGRILKVPPGLPVRPTTDFAKSGLFNILNNRIDFESLKVLDLFCGTGNITFEFASRGAALVHAIDMHTPCVHYVQAEAQKLGFTSVQTTRADVFKFIQQKSRQYDLIFVDPPYETEKYAELYTNIIENDFLAEDGLLIIEHPKRVSFADAPLFKEEREYGNVHFSFFEK